MKDFAKRRAQATKKNLKSRPSFKARHSQEKVIPNSQLMILLGLAFLSALISVYRNTDTWHIYSHMDMHIVGLEIDRLVMRCATQWHTGIITKWRRLKDEGVARFSAGVATPSANY